MNQQRYWETIYRYFRDQGVPREVLGHFCISPAESAQISTIIEQIRPHTILEVGTFIGVSTGIIALASAKIPDSMLVCVDPNWPVEVQFAHLGFHDKRTSQTFVHAMLSHFGQAQRTTLLSGFFSYLSEQTRQQIVTLGNGPDQAIIIGERIGKYAPIDLAFLDGDHQTDAVYHDLVLLAPYMAQNGIIVLHDVSGDWGERVCAGIELFIQENPYFSLYTDHNLGFLSRDVKRAWLVPQRDPVIGKVRRKILTLTGSL
jgi:predicted O-methyltransferase YrrM